MNDYQDPQDYESADHPQNALWQLLRGVPRNYLRGRLNEIEADPNPPEDGRSLTTSYRPPVNMLRHILSFGAAGNAVPSSGSQVGYPVPAGESQVGFAMPKAGGSGGIGAWPKPPRFDDGQWIGGAYVRRRF